MRIISNNDMKELLSDEKKKTCIDDRSFRPRRFSPNNDVREELRHRLAVRRQRPEVRLGPLLQLHQRLLRHRPVQRRRDLWRPQLAKTGTAPAAGARAAVAGLSELSRGIDGKWPGGWGVGGTSRLL